MTDFCNEHVFICSGKSEITASQLNQKNKNFNIVRELLWERPDLVDKYFSEEHFSLNDFYKLIREFNTTEPEKDELTEDDEMELAKDSSAQTNTSVIQDSVLPSTEIPCLPIEEVRQSKKIIGTSNPFRSSFSKKEIELLTNCINEVQLFTTEVTFDILSDFFSCTLDGALKSNNTRLLTYLMAELGNRKYITYEWQSVIANNKLVLGKIKDKFLTRNDLSSANDNSKGVFPKGHEIIDKYIKELKKG